MDSAAMGFVMGSSCPLRSPVLHSLASTSSSTCSSYCSSSSSHSICLFSYPRTAAYSLKKNRKITVCMHQKDSEDINLFARRATLFVGFSVLPFLKMMPKTLESSAAEGSVLKTEEEDKRAEEKVPTDASGNPFVSLLGGLGIFASGVLGAFYALTQKEKANSEATIESLSNKLKEKESASVSMGKKFESELMNEKEIRNEQLRKVREEQQSLVSQLKSANDTVAGLGQELQKEKKIVQELEDCVDDLQTDLMKAREEKKELQEKLREKDEALRVLEEKINLLSLEIKNKDDNLRRITSALAEKELEWNKLSSTYQQLQDELGNLNLEKKDMKDKLLKNEKELELKDATIADLNARIDVLHVEIDESKRKFNSIQKEFSDLKSSSQKKAAEDSKLLEDREDTLRQFKEQLESSLNEVSKNKVLVGDLTLERDKLKKMTDVELENVKNLEQELRVTQENLEKSRNEAMELTRQLQQSRDLCLDLEAEISKVRSDFAEARESLNKTAEEARRGAQKLAGELMSLKELLKKKDEETKTLSHELATVVQSRDGLQKELIDVYKKAESAVSDLHEEKTVVASLNEELKALETQISKEREARKSLEGDLEETARSLNEINQNASILSRELELANSQISILEDEKDALHKFLAEQKQVSQEARENMEDAHSLVMRLGEERQNLEKKTKKLEEELASAKGEILRLRSQTNSSKTIVNDQPPQAVEVAAKSAAPVKRTTRRRRAAPRETDS